MLIKSNKICCCFFLDEIITFRGGYNNNQNRNELTLFLLCTKWKEMEFNLDWISFHIKQMCRLQLKICSHHFYSTKKGKNVHCFSAKLHKIYDLNKFVLYTCPNACLLSSFSWRQWINKSYKKEQHLFSKSTIINSEKLIFNIYIFYVLYGMVWYGRVCY